VRWPWTYRELVYRLGQHITDVAMLQDFVSAPTLREVITSKEGKAWILPSVSPCSQQLRWKIFLSTDHLHIRYEEGTAMAVMLPDNPVAHKSVARYVAAMKSVCARALIPGIGGALRRRGTKLRGSARQQRVCRWRAHAMRIDTPKVAGMCDG
jgi:hypothetical protein